MRGRSAVRVAVAIAIALVAVSCGNKNQVGSGVKLKGNSSGNGALRDVVTTTTIAKAAATTATTRSSVTTTRPAPTTTTRPTIVLQVIDETKTTDGSCFKPNQTGVPRGYQVKWQYASGRVPQTQVRVRLGDPSNGQVVYTSNPVALGATTDTAWIPLAPGVYGVSDLSRNYCHGQITVN